MSGWINNLLARFRQSWVPWSLFVGFWTVLGLSFASQFYLSSRLFGYYTVTWGQAISVTLGDWYVWALLSLPIISVARRFPLHRRNWHRLVVIHVTFSLVICLAYVLIRAAIGQLQNPMLGMTTTFRGTVEQLLLKNSLLNLIIYWIIVSVSHAFDYYRKFRDREVETADLERRLVEARLMALQMQLNPHFLFNTLHTISALVHKDPDAADEMIARLSGLLRLALENTDANEVPLREELDFLQRYLEIEQTRFGARLKVSQDIASETLDGRVPNLLLQPLVENAIRHGVERTSRPGVIELRAWREGDRLHLEVADNGRGVAAGQPVRPGVGLSNTRSRLHHLYGDRQTFRIRSRPEGGLTVSITLPFVRAATGAAPAAGLALRGFSPPDQPPSAAGLTVADAAPAMK
ncbi:MAG: sensor histidine kinase [Verrucomicrobiales bacterium]|nr:sensor histidine kinase [Verrucomicrobiales bacterium]